MAQMVERVLGKDEVVSSNLIISSTVGILLVKDADLLYPGRSKSRSFEVNRICGGSHHHPR